MFSVVHVARSLVFCVVFCRPLTRFHRRAISSLNHTKMCVLVCEISLQIQCPFTVSDDLFGIFKHVLLKRRELKQKKFNTTGIP